MQVIDIIEILYLLRLLILISFSLCACPHAFLYELAENEDWIQCKTKQPTNPVAIKHVFNNFSVNLQKAKTIRCKHTIVQKAKSRLQHNIWIFFNWKKKESNSQVKLCIYIEKIRKPNLVSSFPLSLVSTDLMMTKPTHFRSLHPTGFRISNLFWSKGS